MKSDIINLDYKTNHQSGMCGGVGYTIKNISDQELKKFFSPSLIDKIKENKRIETFYWYKDPILPVKTKRGIQLMIWGNKDKNLKLPQTGWAKQESLTVGKWNWLHPEIVDIPVDSGYEKKVWFDLPEGTKGVIVKDSQKNVERVYTVTKPASKKYIDETSHDREPLGEKKNYRKEEKRLKIQKK